MDSVTQDQNEENLSVSIPEEQTQPLILQYLVKVQAMQLTILGMMIELMARDEKQKKELHAAGVEICTKNNQMIMDDLYTHYGIVDLSNILK